MSGQEKASQAQFVCLQDHLAGDKEVGAVVVEAEMWVVDGWRGAERGGREECVCVCVCGAECCGVGGVTFLPERTLEQCRPPAAIIEKKKQQRDLYADNDIDKDTPNPLQPDGL